MGNFSKLLPTNSDSVPKWQVALIASIPVAFGLGYLYYKFNFASKSIVVSEKVVQEKVEKQSKKEISDDTCENVVLTPAKKAEKLKEKGNVCFKQGDYTDAIKYYSEAIDICPEGESSLKATFYQNRAAAYERLNELNKVLDDCTESLKLNQRYTKALMRRAKAAERLKNIDLSLEDIACACILEYFRNPESLGELDRIAKATANRDAEAYIANHIPKLPSSFFIKTYVSTYKKGSALDLVDMNDDSSVHLLKKFKSIEEALFACENIENSCKELIEECVKANNDIIKFETLLLRATYYILSKQNPKAILDLDEIINSDNVDSRVKVNALTKRGTLYQHQGDKQKREDDFEKAIEVDENNPDIYHHLGQIHLILGDPSESVNNFRKAVALDPDFPVTVVQHCYAEYKYAQSIEDNDGVSHHLQEFRNILKRFPGHVECLTLYAQVLTERQEYAESEKLFNDAIIREPKHAALLVHKALLCLQWKADVEKARELIRKALELDADCEFAYETIATIEMQMGNYKKAVEYFDEAIKRFTSVEELYHLFCVRNTSLAQVKAEERVGRINPMDLMGANTRF